MDDFVPVGRGDYLPRATDERPPAPSLKVIVHLTQASPPCVRSHEVGANLNKLRAPISTHPMPWRPPKTGSAAMSLTV